MKKHELGQWGTTMVVKNRATKCEQNILDPLAPTILSIDEPYHLRLAGIYDPQNIEQFNDCCLFF